MARRHKEAGPLLTQTRGLLRHFDLRARKGLGQHFLVNEEVLQVIASAAELATADVVVEVGPGLGILTGELARQAGWVIAVELDSRLAAILKQTLAPADNFSIINEDILKIDPSDLIQQEKTKFPPEVNPSRYKLVANLPYYITSPILRHFLETRLKPQIMVVMVQKEVAEAITATPGYMSLLSIGVQFHGNPAIISYVPAGCFYPAPEVDSAIIKIVPYHRPPVAVNDEISFFKLVRAGFCAPRKQLINSLAQGLELPKAGAFSLLQKAEIAPQRRAETLALDEWARLWQVFTEAGNQHADLTGAG